jgi:hypothetical protein
MKEGVLAALGVTIVEFHRSQVHTILGTLGRAIGTDI